MIRHWLLLITLLNIGFFSHANEFIDPGPKVVTIEQVSGERFGIVRKIVQGDAGFLWLATETGLVRFDGQRLRRFKHDTQQNSLSNNTLTDLVEDSQGALWLATWGGGLNHFDKTSQTFEHFGHALFGTEHIFAIGLSKDDNLWLGTDKGLVLFNPQTKRALRYDTNLHIKSDDTELRVVNLHEDNTGRLWFVVHGQGLFRYDPSSNSAINLTTQQPEKLSKGTVTGIFQDRSNNIWLAGTQGVTRIDSGSNQLHHFDVPIKASNKIGSINIQAVFEDSQGTLWLGSLYNGLSRFDATTNRFVEVNPNAGRQDSFSSLSVTDIYEDKSGALWLTTLKHGLAKITTSARRFQHFSGDAQHDMLISALFSSANNHHYIAANNKLYQLDPSGMSVHLKTQLPGYTNAITELTQGELALSVYNRGIYRYHIGKGQLESFAGVLPNNNLATVSTDQQRRLWVSLYQSGPNQKSGLFVYEPHLKQFVQHLSDRFIQAIIPLDDNALLLGDKRQGLAIYDYQQQELTPITTDQTIWTLFKDSAGNLWAGTEGQSLGLLQYQQGQWQFKTALASSAGDKVYVINEDSSGKLWLGTEKGLALFDPATSQIRNFNQHDGLRIDDFMPFGSLKTQSGQIFMGSERLLAGWLPRQWQPQPSTTPQLPTLLTELKILNKSIKPMPAQPDSVLQRTLFATDELSLSYLDSLFSLSFSTTNYDKREKLHYAYKMEGLDSQWIEKASNEASATFTALAPGNYQFKVKVSDEQGRFDASYQSLKINVLPPWWQSKTAYSCYLILFIFTLYLAHRYRTLGLIKRAKALEQGVAERTATINRLLNQKKRTFANVSHEFRTPLTLILAPLEQLINELAHTKYHTRLAMIKRSGTKLLHLVEQMLSLARLGETTTEPLVEQPVKLLLTRLAASFEPILQQHNQTLQIVCKQDICLYLKADALESILLNLLSNAVKYTKPGGHIEIKAQQHDNHCVIVVRDDGIGISRENQKIVFERFTRLNDEPHRYEPGAGIGLALVKQWVETSNGNIDLKSKVGRGSTFTITLPITPISDSDRCPQPQIESTSIELTTQTLHQQLSPTEPTPHIDNKNEQHRPTLLLIDDNRDMLNLLQQILQDEYNCITARNGAQGIRQAQVYIPDVIICDVMMPGMNGFEVAQQLRQCELCCHIPLLLLTAKGDLDSRLKGWQSHVDDYLTKPFAQTELLARIRNLLSIRQMLKTHFSVNLQQSEQTADCGHFTRGAKDQLFIRRVENAFAKYYQQTGFDRVQLAQQLAVSERQLHRKFDALFGQSFTSYLRSYRLNQSLKLLRQGYSIGQTSDQSGFSSTAYFSKCFKAEFGQTPKSYQENHEMMNH